MLKYFLLLVKMCSSCFVLSNQSGILMAFMLGGK